MYYVAKTYEHVSPSIVEEFQSYEDAAIYVALMHKNGKGKYIVLTMCEFIIDAKNGKAIGLQVSSSGVRL